MKIECTANAVTTANLNDILILRVKIVSELHVIEHLFNNIILKKL